MKKWFLSILVTLTLIFNFSAVFAQQDTIATESQQSDPGVIGPWPLSVDDQQLQRDPGVIGPWPLSIDDHYNQNDPGDGRPI